MVVNSPITTGFDGPAARRHRVGIDGSSGPFLVMLHGFGTDQSAWNRIAPKLAEEFRVVRLDMAGAGPNAEKSFDPRRYGDVEAHVDDLLRLIDELNVKAFHFIGASVGGMIGALASIEKPELFRSLILLGTSPQYLNDEGYYGGFAGASRRLVRGDECRLPQLGFRFRPRGRARGPGQRGGRRVRAEPVRAPARHRDQFGACDLLFGFPQADAAGQHQDFDPPDAE
jgi:pimeloyl-ACP methyl ester carboxylesterase